METLLFAEIRSKANVGDPGRENAEEGSKPVSSDEMQCQTGHETNDGTNDPDDRTHFLRALKDEGILGLTVGAAMLHFGSMRLTEKTCAALAG